MVCGQEWLTSFSQSFYQFGYVLSGLLIGYISDSYGRYVAICVSIAVEVTGGLTTIATGSIYGYILARTILGFGDSGRSNSLYMIMIETVWFICGWIELKLMLLLF